MAGVTRIAEAPGKAARRPMFAIGPQATSTSEYTFAFPNPYTVGGESLQTIWDDFKTGGVLSVMVDQRADFLLQVDYTNKKLKLFTAIGTESSAVDRSAVTGIHLRASGYAY